eukprot:5875790-Alexandrium_andersonii.AAC.1
MERAGALPGGEGLGPELVGDPEGRPAQAAAGPRSWQRPALLLCTVGRGTGSSGRAASDGHPGAGCGARELQA